MTYHVEINTSIPKGNNDVRQSVTCNQSSLFAPKERKRQNFQMFLNCETLIHSCMKLRHERTQRLQNIHSIQQKCELVHIHNCCNNNHKWTLYIVHIN